MTISDSSEKWTRRGGLLRDETRQVKGLIVEEEEKGNLGLFMLGT